MRISRFLFAVVLLTALTRAQSDKPDFTGVWVLNTAKSKLTIPNPPVTSTFIFIQRGTKWHMERTHFFRDKKPNTIHFERVIGGEPVIERHNDYVETARMFWEGNTVVLDEQFVGSDNTHGSNHVTYSLSPDGNTLTALEIEIFPDGKFTNRWVFDRLPMPIMKDRYPGTGLTDADVAELKRTIERNHRECDPKHGKLDLDYALLDLGPAGPGVIARSSRKCDCGATGNCAMYVLLRQGGNFHELMIGNNAARFTAPSGWPFGTTIASGHLFLVVGSHMSADSQLLSFYELVDGQLTLLGGWCKTVRDSSTSGETTKVVIDDCGAP